MHKIKLSHHLHLHLIIFILGFTAILGKLISIPTLELVWFRMLIASITLFAVIKFRKINYALPFNITMKIFGVGLLVAIHWLLFFHSIKVSNVTVALGCFSTITFFTSFIEPFFHQRKISWLEVLLGIIVLGGLYLIFQFETKYKEGIILATLSAFIGSLFIVLNGKFIKEHNAITISWYEMTAGFFGISIYRLFIHDEFIFQISSNDTIYLLILGIVCTAYAFMKTTDLMKYLSPYYITLSINLEPIYGIAMAFFIFGESEKMTAGFYLGTSIVLLAVCCYPILNLFFKKK